MRFDAILLSLDSDIINEIHYAFVFCYLKLRFISK